MFLNILLGFQSDCFLAGFPARFCIRLASSVPQTVDFTAITFVLRLHTSQRSTVCILHASRVSFRGLTKQPVTWNKAIIEKPTVSQLFKKIPTFYGNRKFISAFTTAHYLHRSWGRLTQPTFFMLLNPHFNSIIPATSGSSKRFFTRGFPTTPRVHLPSPP